MSEFDPMANVPPELWAERDVALAVLQDVDRRIAAARLAALTEEPKCPECCSGVLRPKCFYELGGDCPRHEVVAAFGGSDAIRKRLAEKPE
jgi:hypothetical protein